MDSPAPDVAGPGGPAEGGTEVTLHGVGLSTVTGVAFGGVAAASFTLVDGNTVTAVPPPPVAAARR